MAYDLERYKKLLAQHNFEKEFEDLSNKLNGKKVILYGAGVFFQALAECYDLKKYLNIVAISDKKFETTRSLEFCGFEIIKPSELEDVNADVILTCVLQSKNLIEILNKVKYKNIQTILPIIKNLNPYAFLNDVNVVKINDEKYLYEFSDINVKVYCDNYTQIIDEVFFGDDYSIENTFELDDFIVVDFGMNRGYTVLNFASMENCKRVYGFEPTKETFDCAIENIDLNPHLKGKIEIYNFGLSDKNTVDKIYHHKSFDAFSTTNNEYLNKYDKDIIDHSQEEEITLKKASEVVLDIFKKEDNTLTKILKMDIEGSEFEVIPNLYDENLLNKFDIVVGETHFINSEKTSELIFDYFYKSGFKVHRIFCNNKNCVFTLYKNVNLAKKLIVT